MIYKNTNTGAIKEHFRDIYTIGCFDLFHIGHENMLHTLRKACDKLIVGVHSSKSLAELKGLNISDVQPYEERLNLVKFYATDTFKCETDPTGGIRAYYKKQQYPFSGNVYDVCFFRGNDKFPDFPGSDYIKEVMDIYFLPYHAGISSSKIRGSKKLMNYNHLLQTISSILEDNNISYYLDVGTLLGCIRDGVIMEKDTDVDISIHLSDWDNIKRIKWPKGWLCRVIERPNHLEGGRMLSFKIPNSKRGLDLLNDHYLDLYAMPAFPLLDETILFGKVYPIPVEPTLYIEQLYGKDWRIPSGYHADWKFHRSRGLVESDYSKHWDKNYEILYV